MGGLAPVIRSFHWTRNSRFFNIAKDPRVSMRRRSGTLVIDFRSGGRPEEYEGEYQCFARNKFGTALSNRIRLQVSSECQGQGRCWLPGGWGACRRPCPPWVSPIPERFLPERKETFQTRGYNLTSYSVHWRRGAGRPAGDERLLSQKPPPSFQEPPSTSSLLPLLFSHFPFS